MSDEQAITPEERERICDTDFGYWSAEVRAVIRSFQAELQAAQDSLAIMDQNFATQAEMFYKLEEREKGLREALRWYASDVRIGYKAREALAAQRTEEEAGE